MIRSLLMVILGFAIAGCSNSRPSPSAPVSATSQQVAVVQAPLMPEAQRILDDLNSWNKDAIDGQEFRHASDTGETTAYINDAKSRLANLGTKVKWNHEKRIYEVVETGDPTTGSKLTR